MNLNLIYPYNASNRVNHSFINRGSDHVHTDHTPNDPTCTEPPNSHMPGAQAWRSVKRRHAKAASRWLSGSMMAYERRTTLINHGNHERMSKHTTLPRSELFVGFRFIVFSASELYHLPASSCPEVAKALRNTHSNTSSGEAAQATRIASTETISHSPWLYKLSTAQQLFLCVEYHHHSIAAGFKRSKSKTKRKWFKVSNHHLNDVPHTAASTGHRSLQLQRHSVRRWTAGSDQTAVRLLISATVKKNGYAAAVNVGCSFVLILIFGCW